MNDEIKRNDNRIVIKGNVWRNDLRPLCSALYQTIKIREWSDVILDFSPCAGVAEAVMLPLMPIIADYQKRGVNFQLIEPQDDNLQRLFFNTNWAHYIDPDKYDRTLREGGHVPALRFGDDGTSTIDEILAKVMNLILGQLETDRATLKAVEWSLGEIMDNVVNHSQSQVGGFVQATAYKNANQVEFVVADAGIGIPGSMNISNHAEAIRQAINEGVTRDKNQNAGNGLYGSYRVATLSGGRFEINSLKGSLFCRENDGEIVNRSNPIPYCGTSVRCGVNVSDTELLSKALRFKGHSHDPPYDYIERKFENKEGELIFNVKDEAQRDTGSRQGGKRIRGMLENLLRENRPLVLDFDGVGVISSSFADEVFGRLFVEMGPRAFMSRIEMRNVDPTVEGLIDRAIMQRTRLDNGDA
ncbi:MAG: DUF4325 domain-containing protein [Nitrospira sp.]|nr:DUF4325 domain-containing protein [Nitrospira sp.]MDE0403801.1 DUF4325 domain-containing protein [Nitrospira sp.]MDE0485897.1 DUF4325 domain-containing protein [Nitrospira sp.]